MSYVIVEWKKLKKQHPEFQEMVAALEQKTLEMCDQVWPGMSYGRFNPQHGQYGRTTILPELFRDENGDVLDDDHSPTWWGVDNFRQYYSDTSPATSAIPGWKTILEGARTGGVTPEDVVINLVGFAIPDPHLYMSKLRLEIGDVIHVKMGVEEMHMYEQPALIFEDGYSIPEETYFRLRGFFVDEDIFQRVVPLGFAMYRRKDELILV